MNENEDPRDWVLEEALVAYGFVDRQNIAEITKRKMEAWHNTQLTARLQQLLDSPEMQDEPQKVVRDFGDGSKIVQINPANTLRTKLRTIIKNLMPTTKP